MGHPRQRRSIECCTDQDYCNRNLHPTLPPLKPPRKCSVLTEAQKRFYRAACCPVGRWQWCGQGQKLSQHTGWWCTVEIPWHCRRQLKWARQWDWLHRAVRTTRVSFVSSTRLCVSVRLFLCTWQTVSLDSQGTQKPQQTREQSHQSETLSSGIREIIHRPGSGLPLAVDWSPEGREGKLKIDEWNVICSWFTVHQLFHATCEERLTSLSVLHVLSQFGSDDCFRFGFFMHFFQMLLVTVTTRQNAR